MVSSHPRQNIERGAAFMIGAAFLFAGMGAAVKTASETLPTVMVVFFRNAVSLLVLLPWLGRRGYRGLATRRLRDHLVRGLAGLLAMACFFYAVGRLRLADAVLLNYSLPLLLPFVERAWLGEPISRRLWRPLLLGFGGLLLILRPTSGVFQVAALAGLAAAGLGAVAQVAVRRLTRTEPTTRIVFYFSLIATAVSALPVPAVWKDPSPGAWAALAASGLLATGGQLLMTRAYACAPAGQVGPFLYCGVVFSGLLDWYLWQVLPDPVFVLGALSVLAAVATALRLRSKTANGSE